MSEQKEPTHVDHFIDFGTGITKKRRAENEDYARWVLMHFRLPAMLSMAFEPFFKEHKLFAMYQGKKFRVIGASRLGDVWLTSKFENDTGYEHRVCVDDLSGWSKE